MTSDHPWGLITTAALALALGLGLEASAETIAGTDLEAAELVVDLPWTFEVKVEPEEPRRARRRRGAGQDHAVPLPVPDAQHQDRAREDSTELMGHIMACHENR